MQNIAFSIGERRRIKHRKSASPIIESSHTGGAWHSRMMQNGPKSWFEDDGRSWFLPFSLLLDICEHVPHMGGLNNRGGQTSRFFDVLLNFTEKFSLFVMEGWLIFLVIFLRKTIVNLLWFVLEHMSVSDQNKAIPDHRMKNCTRLSQKKKRGVV